MPVLLCAPSPARALTTPTGASPRPCPAHAPPVLSLRPARASGLLCERQPSPTPPPTFSLQTISYPNMSHTSSLMYKSRLGKGLNTILASTVEEFLGETLY